MVMIVPIMKYDSMIAIKVLITKYSTRTSIEILIGVCKSRVNIICSSGVMIVGNITDMRTFSRLFFNDESEFKDLEMNSVRFTSIILGVVFLVKPTRGQ